MGGLSESEREGEEKAKGGRKRNIPHIF